MILSFIILFSLFQVLVFVVSDFFLGVGIQVDIFILVSLGCYLLMVVIVLIVQDMVGIQSVYLVSVEFVEFQVCVIFEDMLVVVFKIGVLGSVENVLVVVEIVVDYLEILFIFDFVLVFGWGDELVDEEIILVICEMILLQIMLFILNLLEV